MAGHNNWPLIINLGNSIIGVSVLAMPYCFKQCGILLGMLVLLFCTWLTLTSCQLLMRAGIHSRRRSYEFLAYHTHGASGKLLSELGLIGLQVGTLIAQIVIIGDLGPAIFSKFLGIQNTSNLRTFLILVLCLGVGLPLGLLKDLRAVSRASTVCVSFYCIFVLYVVILAIPVIQSNDWYPNVHFWRPEGFFQCLPIFSFSFGCQTQLFLLYDALPDPSLKSITGVISSAVNLCAVAYLLVGFFGYVAFYAVDVPGDVISIFPQTFMADLMKICFVFSIVITFPVIIFPCRSSIYTLIFAKKSKAHEDVIDADGYLPESLFKGITVFIIVSCMILGILIPNVEFILGINGAIMGTLICYIFPALFFLKVIASKQEGRGLAKLVLLLGVTILMLSTAAVLNSQDNSSHHQHALGVADPIGGLPEPLPVLNNDLAGKEMHNLPEQLLKPVATMPAAVGNKEAEVDGKDAAVVKDGSRQEPPIPDPPDTKPVANVAGAKEMVNLDASKNKLKEKVENDTAKMVEKLEVIEKVAKENKEKEEELKVKEKKQEELLQQLEKHRDEQEKLLKEQRELLKEFKDHHEQDLKKKVEEAEEAPGNQIQGQGQNIQPAQPHLEQRQQQAPLQVDPQLQKQHDIPVQVQDHQLQAQKQVHVDDTNKQHQNVQPGVAGVQKNIPQQVDARVQNFQQPQKQPEEHVVQQQDVPKQPKYESFKVQAEKPAQPIVNNNQQVQHESFVNKKDEVHQIRREANLGGENRDTEKRVLKPPQNGESIEKDSQYGRDNSEGAAKMIKVIPQDPSLRVKRSPDVDDAGVAKLVGERLEVKVDDKNALRKDEVVQGEGKLAPPQKILVKLDDIKKEAPLKSGEGGDASQVHEEVADKKRNDEMRRKLKSVNLYGGNVDLVAGKLESDGLQSIKNDIAAAGSRHLLESLRSRD